MASCVSDGRSEKVSLETDQVLGAGSYGKVCRAKRGELACAAKLLHEALLEGLERHLVQEFQRECKILSEMKHPNIVQYLGTYTHPKSRRLVLLMELMEESLTSYLERSPDPLPYSTQLNLSHDVALALSYLHSQGIIHRDLSSNNVLLTGEGRRAKVADFGMSKLMSIRPCSSLTLCPGAAVYMPPEALTTPPQYSASLDCFSFGVLTIQIITKNFPKPERLPHKTTEVERRKKDIELIKSDHPLYPIAIRCLHNDETKRPPASKLCEELEALKNSAEELKALKKGENSASKPRGGGGSEMSKWAIGGAVVGGVAALSLTVVAAPVVLPVLGFSTGGVVAGSLAAGAQAAIGNVAAGSLFATLQSIGAVGGFSAAASATAAGVGTAAGAAAGAGVKMLKDTAAGEGTASEAGEGTVPEAEGTAAGVGSDAGVGAAGAAGAKKLKDKVEKKTK